MPDERAALDDARRPSLPGRAHRVRIAPWPSRHRSPPQGQPVLGARRQGSQEPRRGVQRTTVPAGHSIALEGEGGLVFFVVESGEAVVEVHGQEVGQLGPGDSFGEIALIDRRKRTATVTAKTDLTCYSLPVFVFRPFVESRPRWPGTCSRAWPTAWPPPSLASQLATSLREAVRRDRLRAAALAGPTVANVRPSSTRSASARAGSPESPTVSAPGTATRTVLRRQYTEPLPRAPVSPPRRAPCPRRSWRRPRPPR